MQKALADDFPFDLPRLIDGVCGKWKENEKCVWIFFFLPSQPLGWERGTHPQATVLSSLCMSHKSTFTPHRQPRTYTPSSPDQTHAHTPTYVAAAVLADGVRAGPHLPKCRCWTDCGGVMNGWSRLGRGAEETISAMLISPLLLRPPSIPHSPVLCLRFAPVLSQSIIASLTPSSFLSTPHPRALSPWLSTILGKEREQA